MQALADRLKMTRTAVSRVVNGKVGISIEMAIRLEALLGTSAETWVAVQADYDFWQAQAEASSKDRETRGCRVIKAVCPHAGASFQ